MGEFYSMLKYLRKRAGWSQTELAKRLGVSKSAISMWENGNRAPDPEMMEAIADLFNVDMNFLYGKSGSEDDTYYTDPETARLAQEMFEDPQMRSLFHMKRNMEPEKFKAHYDMMKKMYQLEHPEDGDDWA